MSTFLEMTTIGGMTDAPRIPQIDMPGVARRVTALRLISGLTQDAFAKSFGLDPSSYTKVMKSTKPLKSEHAFAIAERWGVTMDFIYRGDLSKMDETTRAKVIAALSSFDR